MSDEKKRKGNMTSPPFPPTLAEYLLVVGFVTPQSQEMIYKVPYMNGTNYIISNNHSKNIVWMDEEDEP